MVVFGATMKPAIGYELSFTGHFYQPPRLRSLAEITAKVLAPGHEIEGLPHEVSKGVRLATQLLEVSVLRGTRLFGAVLLRGPSG